MLIITLFSINIILNPKKLSLDFLEKAKVDIVAIKRVKIKLPDNIFYDSLYIKNRIDNRRTVSLFIKNTDIEVRLFEAIKNRTPLQKVIVNKFNWHANGKPLLPFIYGELDNEDTLLLNSVQKIKLSDAKIVLDSLGGLPKKIYGINGKVSFKKGSIPRIKSTISIDSISAFNMVAKNITTGFNLNGSLCQFKKTSIDIANGNITLKKSEVDLKQNRLNRATLSGQKLQISKLLKIKKGSIYGVVSFNVDIDTSNLQTGKIIGSGNFKIKNLSLQQLALQKKAIHLTNITSLKNISFKKISTKFSLKKEKIITDTIKAIGEDMSIFASGYIKQKNFYFNYKIKGFFEENMRDSMSAFVWETLLPEKDKKGKFTGRRYFICQLYGVPQDPTLSIDRVMVKSAVKSLGNSIRREFRRLFN